MACGSFGCVRGEVAHVECIIAHINEHYRTGRIRYVRDMSGDRLSWLDWYIDGADPTAEELAMIAKARAYVDVYRLLLTI